MTFFFSKLQEMGLDLFLITDVAYHFKNLHLLKNLQYYLIGLVPINMSPWLIDYPIIIFFNSFLIQLFFFKLLIFVKKNILFKNYFFFKKI